MSVLIVEDSPTVARLLQATLGRSGYEGVVCKECGADALSYLGIDPPRTSPQAVDCILLDIVMPGMDGIEVCRRIKCHPSFIDTPVIMVTIRDEAETLREAFMAGAHDYITKPIREIELLARVKAAITLRQEIVARKAREAELLRLNEKLTAANAMLAELTVTDDLTKVGNRRYFSRALEKEMRKALRESTPLSLILVAVDRFQEFLGLAGRSKGDGALKMISQILQGSLRRTTDHLARISDSQFAILLPNTPLLGAQTVADQIRQGVIDLQIKHGHDLVTVSQGLAGLHPSPRKAEGARLMHMAEEALLRAQQAGGNCLGLPYGRGCQETQGGDT